tara:strand:+ start:1109 stop:1891 length:783 start_codon:yes stop_codon:yes gene_type:complete
MKITRRQLRKLISESMYDPMHGMKSLEEPYQGKIMSVIDNPESAEEDLKQFHHLGDTVADYKDPRPGMPDDSYAGVDDQKEQYLKDAGKYIAPYLPGFLNLPQAIIDAVVEFVFLSSNPTLHIQIDVDGLEEDIGENMFYRASNYPDRNLPENADAVKIVDSYRDNPKNHDAKYYEIYTPEGTYEGVNPFSKIDPYFDPNSNLAGHRTADGQTGFHEGFREEYHKVTTKPEHKIDSYTVERAFIEMMRDLRPDHQEEVIN